MVQVDIVYRGNLRCSATHADSGVTLLTDAPKDNNGEGASFSPTDLVATALGSCMLTIMGITARRLGVNLAGATAQVRKEMAPAPVRKIAQLEVAIRVPEPVSPEHRLQLERAAGSCPVHKSLHPDVQIPVRFDWAG